MKTSATTKDLSRLITGGIIAISVFVLILFFMKLAKSPAYREEEEEEEEETGGRGRQRTPPRASSEIELDTLGR
ncbi:hypothetical protein N3K66_001675 [Trichothecium roseum]|uniref:Uncharacterized protein n=1 Tax=Trichothecium roseum TaxID=47278 RepID=A0ACC0V859_9HYPO|nr:hypothetical protein N3K66_001675 [Trichothecium roseum]